MIIRHGDLNIVKVNSVPGVKHKKKNDNILLEGENTGHMHRLNGGTIFFSEEEPSKENHYYIGYFEVKETTPLTHEEHNTIEIPPGYYKFFSQREWDDIEERRVLD